MCNRKCSFCLLSAPDYEHKNEFINFDLHKKLCDQLKDLNLLRPNNLFRFVEPMLDKNIYKLVNYAKTTLSNARLDMISNGDVLNEKRLKKLYDSGLDRLQISLYDGEEQHSKFIDLGKKLKLTNKKYVLRPRYLPENKILELH